MPYFIVCFLLILWGAPAQAAEISENDRMRGHIQKLEKIYAVIKAVEDMPPVEEGEALAAIAKGYAFLNDEARMKDLLARIRVVQKRGLINVAYLHLIAARLAADDLAGVQKLLADKEAILAVINKPEPVVFPVPEEEPSMFDMANSMAVWEAEMRNAQSKRQENLFSLAGVYCGILAEHAAQRGDVTFLGDILKDCGARKYQAALSIRQGKIAKAYDLLGEITVPWVRRGGDGKQTENRQVIYRYEDMRLFADCRAAPPDPADIAYLMSLKEKPDTILIILAELGAMEAAYDYALAHPAAWGPTGQGRAVLRDLLDHLAQTHADDKARHLARFTGMLEEKMGRCWTSCGAHGRPWWVNPIDMAHVLAKRTDLFAFTLAQEVKDARARFMTLMTMYYAVPQDSVDQFPNCTGNTRACVLAAMARIATDYDAASVTDLGFALYDGAPDATSFMYAVASEFARISGDKALADKMAAQIEKPDAHVVPESTQYWGTSKTIGELAAEVSERLFILYRGKAEAEKFYPPLQNFPRRRYSGNLPESEIATVQRYPELTAAILEMHKDMRRHSWRYYSVLEVPRGFVLAPSQRSKYGNRCVLDRGRFPYEGWPDDL